MSFVILDSLTAAVQNTVTAESNAVQAETLSQTNMLSMIAMFALMILVFYFMLIRPQQKRKKEYKELVNAITENDELMLGGGIVGRVTKMNEQYVLLALNGDDNNIIMASKSAIYTILPRGSLEHIRVR